MRLIQEMGLLHLKEINNILIYIIIYMDKKIYFKNAGFPPINFCPMNEVNKTDSKKERFFQNNTIHNINIRQLLTDTNKKTIIVKQNDDALEVVDTFNRS